MSDEKEAAVRRAAEALASYEGHKMDSLDVDLARELLDASGVWERIDELEAENERLRALLKPAFALIDGDHDITYIAARGCSLEPDSWLREAAVALAETQENAE